MEVGMEQHVQLESGVYDDQRHPDEEQSEGGKPFKFNYERDLPLLLHVRNATFVSNEQMYCFFMESKLERNRRCFSWRLQRLIAGDLIRVMPEVRPYKGPVYAITRLGLATLESYGQGLISINSDSRTLPNSLQAPHFLELNDIRRTFEQTKCLQRWRSERELTSLNYVIGTPLAKDYDAVAEVVLEGEPFRIAIEYERSLKSAARYQEIQKSIQDEGQVDLVLYLTSTMDLVFSLSAEFSYPPIPMCFVSSWKFKQNKLATNLILRYGEMKETCSLRFALENIILAIK
jgi:hypothetical protein